MQYRGQGQGYALGEPKAFFIISIINKKPTQYRSKTLPAIAPGYALLFIRTLSFSKLFSQDVIIMFFFFFFNFRPCGLKRGLI